MIEQPKYTPYCCGQTAKWVNPTLNLAYFYCEKCKKEVVESDTIRLPGMNTSQRDQMQQKDALDAMRQVMASTSIPLSPTWGGGPKLPDPPRPLGVFRVGDTVSFDYNDGTQKLRTFGYIESLGPPHTVRELNTGRIFYRYGGDLTLVQ